MRPAIPSALAGTGLGAICWGASNARARAVVTDLCEHLQAALSNAYALERELGRGGMATVYLARDLKHDRHVALKALAAEVAAGLHAERFLREVRLVARLSHPRIVPVLHAAQASDLVYCSNLP